MPVMSTGSDPLAIDLVYFHACHNDLLLFFRFLSRFEREKEKKEGRKKESPLPFTPCFLPFRNPDIDNMPSMPTCISPSATERWCFLAVRKETFCAKTVYACLAAITLCVALLPVFVTGAASFGAAHEECYAKTVVRLKVKFLDVDSSEYDPTWTEEDNFDDMATSHMFPVHSFNSISTVVSLFGFGMWLFFSPHNSEVEKDLDRTLGSYFALQWLANLLVLASSLTGNCSDGSGSADVVGLLVYLLASFGLSTIGTNLLCHRHLCEKARIMIKMYDPRSMCCVFNALRCSLLLLHLSSCPPPPSYF
jgi:hypothetical protein